MFSLEDFLFKRTKVVNNWALISSLFAPEIPFKINILCVFIVLRPNYCIWRCLYVTPLPGSVKNLDRLLYFLRVVMLDSV